MTRDEAKELQTLLISTGFLPPFTPEGRRNDDGVYGPATKRAYEHYIASRPKEMTVMVPNAAKPWWESKALISSISTVAIGVGTLAAVVGTGGIAALATPEAIAALGAVVTGTGGIYGTVTRTQQIDPDLVVRGVRITRSVGE
jgi:peptidoglycan hydrolase-like protein with peptidoglycan-binding domain